MNKSRKTVDFYDLLNIIDYFKSKKTRIKINTVVSRHNYKIDMTDFIRMISPDKWKLFKVLPISFRDNSISDENFQEFIIRHNSVADIIFPEDNEQMTESYIMIDPIGRFFQNSSLTPSNYVYSKAILDVGVKIAFEEVEFCVKKFSNRYHLETRNMNVIAKRA